MKIAVNLRLFFAGKIGGLENYVRHVVGGLAQEAQRRNELLTIFAVPAEVDAIKQFAPCANVVTVTPEKAVTEIGAELKRGRYDLLFCPLLVLEPLRPGVKSAITIPDLQHEFFPEFFGAPDLRWRQLTYPPSVSTADIVFTVSEYSKSTFIQKYGTPPEKIVVVDHGVDPEFEADSTPAAVRAWQGLGLPQEYLFYPANFWPHKNHGNLLRAFQRLAEGEFPKLGLVFTGAALGSDEVRKVIKELKLTDRVFLLPYQERSTIAEIYRHAQALTFVSQFEGFGIPLLEAFHTGCPVVASNTCSCPEVAGDAAVYVDPADPESIAGGIRSILTDKDRAARLVEYGRTQAKKHHWRNAVDSTLRAFAELEEQIRREPPKPAQVQDRPVVSIVTPTYNMGHFLEETIQSVLGQDYPNIEYLVMDGGSTDNTRAILEKYSGCLKFISEKDDGQADAIQKGFASTSGKIFTFLNADDTYLPGAVGKAVEALQANPGAGMVYGEAFYVDEKGKTIDRYPTYPFDPVLLSQRCYICQPAGFLWREVWEAAGGINPELHFALDYDLWARVAKLYPMVKIDEYLATSRMYGDNKTMGKRKEMYQETLAVTMKNFGYVPYEPLLGYSAYLVDGKDQIFEVSRMSAVKLGVCLGLGLYYNRQQPKRYLKEWAHEVGILREFTGRYPDGWISNRYVVEEVFDEDTELIVITGQHDAPLTKQMTVTAKLNGKPMEQIRVSTRGRFAISMECPGDARGRKNTLEIEASPTFRPWRGGDYRRLTCVIESVRLCRVKDDLCRAR